jgi:hypothetical protein
MAFGLTASFGGGAANYGYNALGERVRRTVATFSTHDVYEEAGHLSGEYDGSGALIQETVWMGESSSEFGSVGAAGEAMQDCECAR